MMTWLRRLLGASERPVPIHIQEARDIVAAAEKATTEARSAIKDYWTARKTTDDLLDEYIAAEAHRANRRKH